MQTEGQASAWTVVVCVVALPAMHAFSSLATSMSVSIAGAVQPESALSGASLSNEGYTPRMPHPVSHVGSYRAAASSADASDADVDDPSVQRLAGDTRYATAAEIASRNHPDGAETVVLVNGEGLTPDSLVAGPYAAQHDAPVLLTKEGSVPAETMAAIRDLDAQNVVLIGGSEAVDGVVAEQLERAGLSVERIAGENRYETAERVASELAPSEIAFVASGSTLVDALPGASAASAMNAPILYVEGDEVRSQTFETLDELGVREVVVLGGPHSVSDALYDQLNGRFSARRVAGSNRYETAALIAQYMLSKVGSAISFAMLARGDNPIDAVAAGATGAPVLLTPQAHLSWHAARFLSQSSLGATLLGAEVALASLLQVQLAGAYRTTFVDNRTELLDALDQARDGDTIYVDDNAVIDLSDDENLVIPAGVTLQSGRGLEGSEGALLAKNRGTSAPLFVLQEGASIRNVRLRGPDTSMQCQDCAPRYLGIDIRGDRAVVEGSEIWGWPMAIRLRHARHARVRENHIHHNRRSELGYGVVLYGSSDAIIEHNQFNDNRHAVAGSGEHDQSYIARYNHVTGGANGHIFDMHGESENPMPGRESSRYAGNTIHIHHNTVVVPEAAAAFLIRGIPADQAIIENNCFSHGSQGTAVRQTRYTGNLTVRSNRYGHIGSACH